MGMIRAGMTQSFVVRQSPTRNSPYSPSRAAEGRQDDLRKKRDPGDRESRRGVRIVTSEGSLRGSVVSWEVPSISLTYYMSCTRIKLLPFPVTALLSLHVRPLPQPCAD